MVRLQDLQPLQPSTHHPPLPSQELPATRAAGLQPLLHSLLTLEQLSLNGHRDSLNTWTVLDFIPNLTAGHRPGTPQSLGTTAPLKTCWQKASLSQELVKEAAAELSAAGTPGERGRWSQRGLPLLLGLRPDPLFMSCRRTSAQEKQLVLWGSQEAGPRTLRVCLRKPERLPMRPGRGQRGGGGCSATQPSRLPGNPLPWMAGPALP